MTKWVKSFFASFKARKNLGRSYLVDIMTVFIIALLVIGFGNILNTKAFEISNGKTTDEINALILAGNIVDQEQFLNSMKSFTFYFIFGSLILLIAVLMLFSLSRKYLWSKLTNKEFKVKKQLWRWTGLNVIIFIFLLIYLLVYVVLRLILNYFLVNFSTNISNYILSIISSILILFFLSFCFLIYLSFINRYKIWESIGAGFSLFKQNLKKILIVIFFSTLSLIIISLLLIPVNRHFLYQPNLLLVINSAVLLLFLAWFRMYILESLGEMKTDRQQ